MPWPVYSERFVKSTQANTWVYYEVPPASRAVVRSIGFHNAADVPLTFYCTISDVVIARVSIQALADPKIFDMRHVLYQGEQLGLYCGGTGGHQIASGYLFADAGGAASDPPPTQEGPPPDWFLELDPLPAPPPPPSSSS